MRREEEKDDTILCDKNSFFSLSKSKSFSHTILSKRIEEKHSKNFPGKKSEDKIKEMKTRMGFQSSSLPSGKTTSAFETRE